MYRGKSEFHRKLFVRPDDNVFDKPPLATRINSGCLVGCLPTFCSISRERVWDGHAPPIRLNFPNKVPVSLFS